MLATTADSLKVQSWPDVSTMDGYKVKGNDITSVSWSKNNAFMLYLERNGRPQIISLKDKMQIKVIHCITAIDCVTMALFSRNRNGTVAVGTDNATVALYDTHSKTIMKLYDVPGSVVALDFNLCDKYLGIVCKEGQLIIMNLNDHQTILNGDIKEPPTSIRFHPGSRDVFGVGTKTGKFLYMHVKKPHPLWGVSVSMKSLHAFAFYPRADQHLVVTADEDGKVCTYDTTEGRCIFRCVLSYAVTAIDFTCDGMFYGVAMSNGQVCLFQSINPRTPIHVLDLYDRRRINCLRFSNTPRNHGATSSNSYRSGSLTNDSVGTCHLTAHTETSSGKHTILSQEQASAIAHNLIKRLNIDILQYIIFVNSGVQQQLSSFQAFIRREVDKIEGDVQDKWDLVSAMYESMKERRAEQSSPRASMAVAGALTKSVTPIFVRCPAPASAATTSHRRRPQPQARRRPSPPARRLPVLHSISLPSLPLHPKFTPLPPPPANFHSPSNSSTPRAVPTSSFTASEDDLEEFIEDTYTFTTQVDRMTFLD